MDIDQNILDHRLDAYNGVIVGEKLPESAEEFDKILAISLKTWREVVN